MTKPIQGKDKDNSPGFEQRLERLRRIVDELEQGDLPLEKAIERYEEGVGVLKVCAETLAKARVRVEELTRDADGALGARPARDLEDASRNANDTGGGGEKDDEGDE